jgi:hypothetical protein
MQKMKRVKSRITKLEQQAAGEITDSAARLLVTLLGRLDALWWPWRHSDESRAAIRGQQVAYLAGVGSLAARSQGSSNWKAVHFDRNALIEAGLVDAQIESGQVTGLRLTSQGIADAMALVGDRLQKLDHLLTQAILGAIQEAGGWIRENQLFGDSVCSGDNPTNWEAYIEYVLPLLRAGVVEQTSDAWCRAYFAAVENVQLPIEASSLRSVASWGDEVYLEAFDSERAALMRLEALDGGIFIPMRCT